MADLYAGMAGRLDLLAAASIVPGGSAATRIHSRFVITERAFPPPSVLDLGDAAAQRANRAEITRQDVKVIGRHD